MEKLLEKYFIKTYPKIFRDMYGDPKKTCMAFGIECASGWFFILDKLCANIQYHIDTINDSVKREYKQCDDKKVPQLVAHQIKEKFGALRFYKEGGDAYCDALIAFTESLSHGICENCGCMNEDVGRVKTGWIQSLCIFCSAEYGKNIKINQKMKKLWKNVIQSRPNKNRSIDVLYDKLPTAPVIKRGGKGFKT